MAKGLSISLAVVCLFLSPSLSADDQVLKLLKEMRLEIKALRAHTEQSNARIDQLEKQLEQQRRLNLQNAAPNPPIAEIIPLNPVAEPAANGLATLKQANTDKPAVTVGDIKGTFKIPGTETSLGVGGYIKTDLLFNSVSAGRDKLGDQQTVFSQIPVGGAPGEHSQITFLGKESRLWFKSFTPSHWGDIHTFVEFDFYGDSATYTYTPRLRHAYGSMGNLLAGQTWTTYINSSAIADTLDIASPAGSISYLRQPLVRWTQAFKWFDTPIEWQTAFESPRSRVWEPNNLENTTFSTANPNTDNYFMTPNADRYPDLVLRLNFNPDWGNISLAALGRQIRYTNSTGLQSTAWGGGISLAGKIDSIGLDNIRFMLHAGNGEGRYVSTLNTFEDAALARNGQMTLVSTYGGLLSYQHWWNKQWRSNLTYGYASADQPMFVPTLLNKQIQSLHANVLWSPVSQTMLGVEYIYGMRELVDGRSGEFHRVQMSARYNF